MFDRTPSRDGVLIILAEMAEDFIAFAVHSHWIPLEKNISSLHHKNYFWSPFWKMLPENYPVIVGSMHMHGVNCVCAMKIAFNSCA
jgi:hypothetical protein